MDKWEELFNANPATIKFRQAGGMYADIAQKAFKAGFKDGINTQLTSNAPKDNPKKVRIAGTDQDGNRVSEEVVISGTSPVKSKHIYSEVSGE